MLELHVFVLYDCMNDFCALLVTKLVICVLMNTGCTLEPVVERNLLS